MQYVFVSDTHGDCEILHAIFTKYTASAAKIFYNGDSELAANDRVFANVSTVRGNMDFDADFSDEQVYQDATVTVYHTHGHLLGVNQSLTKLLLRAKQAGADIATFGHTHQLGAEVVDGILFINPGSISQPRGQFSLIGGTYAVVEVTADAFDVQYYNRQLEPVEELHFSFTR